MLWAEEGAVHTALLRGEITAVTADLMIRYQGTLQRDLADHFMIRLSLPYLNEAEHGYVQIYFRTYAKMFMNDPAGLDGVAAPVAHELRTAADGYEVAVRMDRLDDFVHRVAGIGSVAEDRLTGYDAALLMRTRVDANRVLDGTVHPYIGAVRIPWGVPMTRASRTQRHLYSLFRRLNDAAEHWRASEDDSKGDVENAICDLLAPTAWVA